MGYFGLVNVVSVWSICFEIELSLVVLINYGLVCFVTVWLFRFGLVRAKYCNFTKMENLGFDLTSTQYLLRLRTVLPF